MRFLTILQTLLLPPLLPSTTNASTAPRPRCKASLFRDDWPTPSQWKNLNRTVGGRLLHPTPPGAVCHPGQGGPTGDPVFDSELCAVVQSRWTDWDFHDKDPVSTSWNQFNKDTCLPVKEYPCSPVGYPRLVVQARGVRDVQRVVEFARKHNVRLNIRGTGHDFIGRSNAPNSLSIWTRDMKSIEFHNSFRPREFRKSIHSTAVTVGAGSQMLDLYEALDRRGQTMIGGGGKTVGISGFVTGGGHGLLSGTHGLASDNVLEVEMVMPDGRVVVANECHNEGLFWAVRGPPHLLRKPLSLVLPHSHPSVAPLMTFILYSLPHLVKSHINGYVISFPISDDTPPVSGVVGTLTMPGSTSPDNLASILDPLIEEARARFGDDVLVAGAEYKQYESFLAWFEENYDASPAGGSVYLGSRLLDEESLTGNLTALEEMVERTVVGNMFPLAGMMVGGPGVWEGGPKGGSAVNEGWRRCVLHAIIPAVFPPLNPAAKSAALERLDTLIAPMRKLAPNTGAYVNEANPFEPDWQHAFWGGKYERLLETKRRVDPGDVLWCYPCVGNERWEEVEGELCRAGGW